MLDGDIDIIRVPIVIDQDAPPDTELVNIAAGLFPQEDYNIDFLIVQDKSLSTHKAVLVVIGRRKKTVGSKLKIKKC